MQPSSWKNNTGRSHSNQDLFFSAVSEAVNGADDMHLESVIKYVNPDFKQALMPHFSIIREDTRRQGQKLCPFTRLMESNKISAARRETNKWTRSRIGTFRESNPRKHMYCHNFGLSGHVKKDCRNQSSSSNEDIV